MIFFCYVVPFILRTTLHTTKEIENQFFDKVNWNRLLPTAVVDVKLLPKDLENLHIVTCSVWQSFDLYKKHTNIETLRARGCATFTNFKDKKDLNQEKIDLYSAITFQKGFNLENVIWYMGGPHTVSHCNPRKIQQ